VLRESINIAVHFPSPREAQTKSQAAIGQTREPHRPWKMYANRRLKYSARLETVIASVRAIGRENMSAGRPSASDPRDILRIREGAKTKRF